MTSTTSVNTPVALDDVRAALADTDPNQTNAGALRLRLGRGSLATIQKHLEAIRAERAPAAPAPGAAPAAPAEAVAALWSAAYSAAQVLVLGRLDKVTEEREQLAGTVARLEQDLGAALAQADADGEAAAAQAQTLREAADAAQAVAEAADAEAADLKQALERARIDFERLLAESKAAEALLKKEAENAVLTLQNTIDRLTDQVGELKSMLPRQGQAPY